jgi:peptidoglycan/xylan/chitin deacetylase (PgdA/CDA1 family)
MAVTFDDLPLVCTCDDRDVRGAAVERLVESIEANGIPATGFVNEGKLGPYGEPDPALVTLLELWLDAGLDLGNHTFSHPDLHRVTVEEFMEDALRGEKVTRALLEERNSRPRWFRHPMLHTGRDLETKHAVERGLAEHGYRVAPVTIDNSEYIFARAYDRALDVEDEGAARRIVAEYLEYMDRKVAYYESQSRNLLGRAIPHVLLLHANRLNADHLDGLVAVLRARGYEFVSLDVALEDPAYESEDRFTGPQGISWLHRWAITRGADGSFFRGEPEAAPWVLEAAGFDSE